MNLATANANESWSTYPYDWALVDVETSGLRPYEHRVLSVAVLTFGADGVQTGEFSTLVNPGCDPGPVEIHGLTAERLRTAPRFDDVADQVAAMLHERVMVAHNAQFDYDFLANEFARARSWLPVPQRLCTLALNRRLDPPTPDLRLGTLAAHYGVAQSQAHDALDDARVLSGVLGGSLAEASRLGIGLPLVACPPRQDSRFAPQPPKTPCAFRCPGRMPSGGPLTQGMKVAITGETIRSRAELIARGVAAGLDMTTCVSRHTSVLVTNDAGAGSTKIQRAAAEGTPIVDEAEYLRLLDGVQPGSVRSDGAGGRRSTTPTSGPTTVTRPSAVPPDEAASTASAVPVAGEAMASVSAPLMGRRVLVLSGTHGQAVKARARIVELGGTAAVNLSASVTDVVVLSGGQADRRMRRVVALSLPVHEEAWLGDPAAEGSFDVERQGQPQHILPRGGVVDLPEPGPEHQWLISANWASQTDCVIDVVAFILDEDEQVSSDQDFVFYGAPEAPGGSVRLLTDGPTEQSIVVDMTVLPTHATKVVIAAAIDGDASFGDIGAVGIAAAPDSQAPPFVRATLDAATTETTMLLAEIYRRGPVWRLRAIGQGYDSRLDALARGFGVDVDD